jgi:hypothetical protein
VEVAIGREFALGDQFLGLCHAGNSPQGAYYANFLSSKCLNFLALDTLAEHIFRVCLYGTLQHLKKACKLQLKSSTTEASISEDHDHIHDDDHHHAFPLASYIRSFRNATDRASTLLAAIPSSKLRLEGYFQVSSSADLDAKAALIERIPPAFNISKASAVAIKYTRLPFCISSNAWHTLLCSCHRPLTLSCCSSVSIPYFNPFG